MIRFLLYVMFIYIQTLRVTLDKDAKALKVLRKFTFNSVRFFEINLPEKEKLKQCYYVNVCYIFPIHFFKKNIIYFSKIILKGLKKAVDVRAHLQ